MCIPADTGRCIFVLSRAPSQVVVYNNATVQNIYCIASCLRLFGYGSVKWNMEENFSMQWNMEWKIFSMESVAYAGF